MQEDQKIHFTYLTGKLIAILIMPLEFAKKNGLNKPSDVIVEETGDRILIKRKSNKSNAEKFQGSIPEDGLTGTSFKSVLDSGN